MHARNDDANELTLSFGRRRVVDDECAFLSSDGYAQLSPVVATVQPNVTAVV
jgi:hypothetical protein